MPLRERRGRGGMPPGRGAASRPSPWSASRCARRSPRERHWWGRSPRPGDRWQGQRRDRRGEPPPWRDGGGRGSAAPGLQSERRPRDTPPPHRRARGAGALPRRRRRPAPRGCDRRLVWRRQRQRRRRVRLPPRHRDQGRPHRAPCGWGGRSLRTVGAALHSSAAAYAMRNQAAGDSRSGRRSATKRSVTAAGSPAGRSTSSGGGVSPRSPVGAAAGVDPSGLVTTSRAPT